MACPPRKFLAFRSSEIDSDAIWMVKVASLYSLQKLLADLGVNVILVTTLAVIGLWLYNLDSYCFKIGTLNSPRGGAKSFQGGANAPPPKRNPAAVICGVR